MHSDILVGYIDYIDYKGFIMLLSVQLDRHFDSGTMWPVPFNSSQMKQVVEFKCFKFFL